MLAINRNLTKIWIGRRLTSWLCTKLVGLVLGNPSSGRGNFILGDPGAVSRAGRKGATKVFKHRWKSPWVPTLTGPFPNGQANAGSWLGTKMLCIIVPNRRTASPEFFSWVRTRRLLTRSRLVWLMHQRNARSLTQSRIFQFDINATFQNTGSVYTGA